MIRWIDGDSYSSRRGTTRKAFRGNRELASVTVRKDGGHHELDAGFSKGVEYIAPQISVGVEDALARVGPSAKMVFHGTVPKSLFQDFGSWVGNDPFRWAGTFDQEFVHSPPVDVVTDGGSHGDRDPLSLALRAVIRDRSR